MRKYKALIIIILLSTLSCVNNTSTSKEYLNQNKVSKDVYLRDVNVLNKVVIAYIDSVNAKKKPKPKSKIFSVKIDTIFYSPDDSKIALLYTTKSKNPYVINNKDSIQFAGGCLIALRNNSNAIKIVDKLKYSVTSSEISSKISRDLRLMYLREMGYIEGKYNINDNRFWDSDIWK